MSSKTAIEFRVDVKQGESYLRTKGILPIRPPGERAAIKKHATKLYRMGLFEQTVARLLRQRWPEADPELVILHVHMAVVDAGERSFGIESLIGADERQQTMEEEPSDFDGSRLEDTEESEQGWIVKDMIPDDDAILNQGDGGAGKTTTMLQLAVAVATGREWLGLPTVEYPMKVTFFSCEERTKKIKLRIKPLLYGKSAPYGNEVGWSDIKNLRIVGLADRDSLIATKDASGRIVPTEMYNFFSNKIRQHGSKLVIIDSLYDVYGGDENTRAQVRQFVSMLRRFTSRHGCALIMLGHPSLYGMSSGTGTSGSTGWRNAFRGMLYTTKIKQKSGTEAHKIESMKGNYGAPNASIDLVWQDGIFVPVHEDEGAKAKGAEAAQAAFLELLATYVQEDRAVTASPNAGNYAPREFARDARAGNFDKRDFADAMNALFTDRQIELRTYAMKNRKTGMRLEPTGNVVAVDDEFEGHDALADDEFG